MQVWFGLLIGCVVAGAAVVAVLVAPRALMPFAVLGGLSAMALALGSFSTLATTYASAEGVAAATAVFVASNTAGYALASALLPSLSHLKARRLPAQSEGAITGGAAEAVVLLACTEPERYSPRAVAARHSLLADTAEVDVPASALPFVFLAEKSRYRAVGGTAPGPRVARSLSRMVAAGATWRTELAWCHEPRSLARTVARLSADGVARIAVVTVGPVQSALLDEVTGHLGTMPDRSPCAPRICFAPSVWEDRELPGHLAGRVSELVSDVDPAQVGVVLVEEGAPPQWQKRYPAHGAMENYFDQRSRMALAELGIDERRLRVAWIDWQSPDVTESVRHLAALGCTRILVVPGAIALPTLETSLDLEHAVALARVPADVSAITLAPWGDQEVFAAAVKRSAEQALRGLRES